MTILLTGIDGYVGWPTALKLAKAFPNERIVGVDNFGRRKWVEECASISALPIASMGERLEVASKNGMANISFIEGDLADRDFVLKLLKTTKPRVVAHVAAQPSAPYSQINGERANYTQVNNLQSTRNLLWGLHELGMSGTYFIETTTTGVYGAPEFRIPEGFIDVERDGKKDTLPFPGMGGSWYHMSKSYDVCNMWLAHKQFKINITDLRTAIVYGVQTAETKLDSRLATRFDFDFFFGTVVNRFIAMAIAGFPITVYGSGVQKKPMISLEDTCTSIVNAVKNLKPGFNVYNQVESPVSIMELAKAIQGAVPGAQIKNIPNPRIEKEEHQMVMDNDRFKSEVLGEFKWNINDALKEDVQLLLKYKDRILAFKDRFMS